MLGGVGSFTATADATLFIAGLDVPNPRHYRLLPVKQFDDV